jgi:hypothetical protein
MALIDGLNATGIKANPEKTKEEVKNTFWEKQTGAFKALLKAIQIDSTAKNLENPEDAPIEKNAAVKAWAKENWVTVLLWGIAIFVIIRVMSEDNSQYRRGHHGINKYGERY